MISGHGNNPEEFRGKLEADFSTSVYFGGMPEGLKLHLAQCLEKLVNYPEPASTTLKERIAAFHGIEASRIIVCNGSTEAFYMLAACFARQRSSILVPSFSEYEDACRLYQHHLEFIDNSTPLSALPSGPGLCWLGNPNNPDGRMYPVSEIRAFCESHPSKMLILDEAFTGMCPGAGSVLGPDIHLPNLVIVRSLTKSFAIPGIRLGYLVGHPEIVDRLSSFRQPWSVNTLAQEAGIYLLDHYNELFPDAALLSRQSQDLQAKLSSLPGLEVKASPCHFFLLRLRQGRASDLKRFLLEQHGILIRDAANFRGLDASYFRVAVRNEVQNQALSEGIKAWISGRL